MKLLSVKPSKFLNGTIGGFMVASGKITVIHARVICDGVVIFDGKLQLETI